MTTNEIQQQIEEKKRQLDDLAERAELLRVVRATAKLTAGGRLAAGAAADDVSALQKQARDASEELDTIADARALLDREIEALERQHQTAALDQARSESEAALHEYSQVLEAAEAEFLDFWRQRLEPQLVKAQQAANRHFTAYKTIRIATGVHPIQDPLERLRVKSKIVHIAQAISDMENRAIAPPAPLRPAGPTQQRLEKSGIQ